MKDNVGLVIDTEEFYCDNNSITLCDIEAPYGNLQIALQMVLVKESELKLVFFNNSDGDWNGGVDVWLKNITLDGKKQKDKLIFKFNGEDEEIWSHCHIVTIKDLGDYWDKLRFTVNFYESGEYLNYGSSFIHESQFIEIENGGAFFSPVPSEWCITVDSALPEVVDCEWSYDSEEDDSKTLYIYKGNIRCKKYNHNIISATATLHNISDQAVVINVEYCKDCHKYLLSYDLFLHYRAKYGVLIGDFKIVTNDYFDGETDLAEESPLHLSGYNVGQKDGYTSNQRHYILAKIIHDGIMTKQAVLNYLSYFVRMNGARSNMELAVSKWREDISFVQNYNISIQPSTIITKITKY